MPTVYKETEIVDLSRLEPDGQAALKLNAHQLAQDHFSASLLNIDHQSLDQLDSQKEVLNQAYTIFRQQAQDDSLSGQEGEWLLDNYYVISSALHQIEQDMPGEYYRQLPRITKGEWRGYPRIYLLAREILAGQPMGLEMDWGKNFVVYYQEISPLSMGELWALPTMLRFNVIERLLKSLEPLSERNRSTPPIRAEAQSTAVEQIVPWSILGLRTLETHNWKRFFEETSLVEQILAQDPAAVYPRMNFETRDSYRKVIERLSRKTSRDEIAVARQVIALALQAGGDIGPANHVGYYLIDDGRPQFEQALSYNPSPRVRMQRWLLEKHPDRMYVSCTVLFTLLLYLIPLAYLYQSGTSTLMLVISSLLLVVPLQTMAVSLASWLMTQLVRPRVLPKMAFDDGIPASCSTMVVIPTLLTDTAEVEDLLQQLELHHLRNQDPNITYALLTDFCDSPLQQMPEDKALLFQATQGILKLNQQHGHSTDNGLFYLFHRKRLWNDKEGCWMGWERKRGKLEEFNQLLLGEEKTSYDTQIGNLDKLPQIRYVITLDSDTTLPHGQARRLIGTLAHPINRARFHPKNGSVTKGYTVLQPRVEVKPTSANQTWFSRIFSGHHGIDLYSIAVSDMYHDLMGEGIYMGKGIYEVATFSRCLIDRVPENTLLSHDLFEGLYGRAGFVSDVIVYEEYPPSYKAYALRSHRWIRGDWQLLPWLLPHVPHVRDGKIRNGLRMIDHWKIFDNLRRSLLRPALMVFLVAGWLWLPGSPLFWTILAALSLASNLVTTLIDLFVQKIRGVDSGDAGMSLKQPLLRWLLELVALPYEAIIASDAIFTVLIRMFITHKRLLQWTTAAHTIRLLGNIQTIRIIWQEMLPAFLLALILAILLNWFDSIGLLVAAPLLFAWLAGPQIMLQISRPLFHKKENLEPEQQRNLRCLTRRTWFFFEQFVGPEDHWLAPDHFQENPRGLVAHRTSPTNIGLMLLSTLAAYDMGYIGLPELMVRLQNTFENLEKLEKFRGHFLNWYDTSTLAPLPPRYVSTVDSGNLACCLVALRQACLAVPDISLPRPERRQGFLDTLSVLNEVLEPLRQAAPKQVQAFQTILESITNQLQSR